MQCHEDVFAIAPAAPESGSEENEFRGADVVVRVGDRNAVLGSDSSDRLDGDPLFQAKEPGRRTADTRSPALRVPPSGGNISSAFLPAWQRLSWLPRPFIGSITKRPPCTTSQASSKAASHPFTEIS